MGLARDLAKTFEDVSREYEAVRPVYPVALVDDILSSFPENGRALDAGCGSGQATFSISDRGHRILGMDHSPSLIDIATAKAEERDNVEFRLGSYDETDFPDAEFDLVVSACAFHWFDQETAYVRAGNMLKPGGKLAIIRTFHSQENSPLSARIRQLYREHLPTYTMTPKAEYVDEVTDRIAQTGLFAPARASNYLTPLCYTKADYRTLIESYSWVQAAPAENRARFFDALDHLLEGLKEPVVLQYNPHLIMATKLSN